MDEGITVSDLQGPRNSYLVPLHFGSKAIPFTVQVQCKKQVFGMETFL